MWERAVLEQALVDAEVAVSAAEQRCLAVEALLRAPCCRPVRDEVRQGPAAGGQNP